MEHSLNAIQLAVAPVFLLTAIATLIGVVATRLGRIIDRARAIEDRLDTGTVRRVERAYHELSRSRTRGLIVNVALALLTISAAFIGTTVVSLFVGGTTRVHIETVVPWSFLGGLLSFMLALLCFLIETLLASEVLKFARRADVPNKET